MIDFLKPSTPGQTPIENAKKALNIQEPITKEYPNFSEMIKKAKAEKAKAEKAQTEKKD